MALGLVMSLKYYRDNQLDGFMSFGKVFSSGISITFFFSILFAVYQYIMFKVDPNMINQIMEEAIQELYNSGQSEENIENFMQISSEFMTPGLLGFSSFLSQMFTGGLFTLLISFFLKRNNPNPFQEA